MVPLAMPQILALVCAVGRSSTFVSVSSQSPLSIPIGFAAAALTAVLSPLPDDRSVQDVWRLSGHTIASLALVTRAGLCVSRRRHPLWHRSERAWQRCARAHAYVRPNLAAPAVRRHRRGAAAYGGGTRRMFACFCLVLRLAMLLCVG